MPALAQDFDLAMKKLVEECPDDLVQLVRWGLPVSSVRREEKEAVFARRDSDHVFRVIEDGFEYLIPLEVQTEPDRHMPERFLEYTSMQHREFGLPIYPVVLNLTGRQRQDTYVLGCLDQPAAVVFRYRIINLVLTPGGEILEKGPLGLIPLVPLMMHDRPLEAVFDECLRRVREAPEDKLPTLELILAVLASRRLPKETILEKMRGSKMEASPLFDGIREKWIEDGETKGKKDMARKLLSRGVAVDVIVEASGLTVAEVEDLKKELEH